MTALSDWNAVGKAGTDAELVRASLTGDQQAFGQMYDRYADRLHDFCVGMLGDRDGAADCVQDAFCRAATCLAQLRDPERLRPWLYSIARNEALRRLRDRRRETPSDELPETATGEAGPETLAARTELADLITDAAGGLSDRDRSVLELAFRHGLDGPELAEALGVTPTSANTIMHRLRETIERSLGALLVARRARSAGGCAELASILKGWDGHFNVLMRKRISRHIESCNICDEERRRLVSPDRSAWRRAGVHPGTGMAARQHVARSPAGRPQRHDRKRDRRRFARRRCHDAVRRRCRRRPTFSQRAFPGGIAPRSAGRSRWADLHRAASTGRSDRPGREDRTSARAHPGADGVEDPVGTACADGAVDNTVRGRAGIDTHRHRHRHRRMRRARLPSHQSTPGHRRSTNLSPKTYRSIPLRATHPSRSPRQTRHPAATGPQPIRRRSGRTTESQASHPQARSQRGGPSIRLRRAATTAAVAPVPGIPTAAIPIRHGGGRFRNELRQPLSRCPAPASDRRTRASRRTPAAAP